MAITKLMQIHQFFVIATNTLCKNRMLAFNTIVTFGHDVLAFFALLFCFAHQIFFCYTDS
ncbi:hypothetical protein DSQ19_07105 [Candidatus Nitrosotenuis sp. DW1]|nr:hypothetical protein DSQ19_07105 [Candidatus Nitrosotenuis sp. DW1]